MKVIFVYGSLKSTSFNFERFGETKVLKKDHKIIGYKIYNLGPYPCIIKTGIESDYVIGEIQLVKNYVFNNIVKMEESAGYELSSFKLDNMEVFFFPMKNNTFNNYKRMGFFNAAIINNGVWN